MELIEVNNVGCITKIDKAVKLEQYAFIYGLNGAGKSTIKELFKNAFEENSKLTPTFGVDKKDCNAKLKVFNTEVKYEKSKLKKAVNGELHVYDTEYVENNIYINGEISEDNKSEYYRLFVGESINKKITDLLKVHSDMNQIIATVRSDISKYRNAIINVRNLLELVNETTIFCAQKFDLEYGIREALKKRIERNLSNITSFKVNWLKQGKFFQKDSNVCPYCGQEISEDINNELISHYETIINETQETLVNSKNQCDDLKNKATQFVSDELYYTLNSNFKTVKNLLVNQLDEKRKHLNESIKFDISVSLKNLEKGLKNFEKFVDDLSDFVDTLNIDNVFTIETVPSNYAKNVSIKLNNIKLRIDNNIVDKNIGDALATNMTAICKDNVKITIGFNKIVVDQNNSINSSVDYINKKFEEYDFKYELRTNVVNEKKLKSSSTPLLELFLVPKACTNSPQKMNKEDLKKVLSEGEKSILSWVFFLLDLNDKMEKGKHFIIIDDPISSYDSFRRFNLATELTNIIKKPATKEILLLSHEKSFTNVLNGTQKFNTFIMKDGFLNKLDVKDIVESDFKNDIVKLSNFGTIDSKEKMLEFMIVSRNVIEYYKSLKDLVKAKYFRINTYNSMYEIASEIIHLQRNDLPSLYLNYVKKIMKKITNARVKFEFDTSIIDVNNLNLNTCLSNISNVYLARVKINKKAIDLLNSNAINYAYDSTTGQLVNKVYENNLIGVDEYEKYKSFLPLLNVYNHVNDNYGLRRVDCEEIKKQKMFDYLNTI